MTTSGAADEIAAAWLPLSERLLRGFAHELSNRTGTIGGAAEALAAADPEGRWSSVLAVEAGRLDELLRLVRLLAADARREAEPVRPADLAADALALLTLRPDDARELPVALATELDDAPPVRVQVIAATRALALLLAQESDAGAPVSLAWEADATCVTLRVAGTVDGAERARACAAAAALVATDGGSARATGSGAELRLPTLAAGSVAR